LGGLAARSTLFCLQLVAAVEAGRFFFGNQVEVGSPAFNAMWSKPAFFFGLWTGLPKISSSGLQSKSLYTE
jgi:hypothetical protein